MVTEEVTHLLSSPGRWSLRVLGEPVSEPVLGSAGCLRPSIRFTRRHRHKSWINIQSCVDACKQMLPETHTHTHWPQAHTDSCAEIWNGSNSQNNCFILISMIMLLSNKIIESSFLRIQSQTHVRLLLYWTVCLRLPFSLCFAEILLVLSSYRCLY